MYCVAYVISMSPYYALLERLIILSLIVYFEMNIEFKMLFIQHVIFIFWNFINVG
jgi:hypothetical protein